MIGYLMDEGWRAAKIGKLRVTVVAIHSRCTNNLKLKLIYLFLPKNID